MPQGDHMQRRSAIKGEGENRHTPRIGQWTRLACRRRRRCHPARHGHHPARHWLHPARRRLHPARHRLAASALVRRSTTRKPPCHLVTIWGMPRRVTTCKPSCQPVMMWETPRQVTTRKVPSCRAPFRRRRAACRRQLLRIWTNSRYYLPFLCMSIWN